MSLGFEVAHKVRKDLGIGKADKQSYARIVFFKYDFKNILRPLGIGGANAVTHFVEHLHADGDHPGLENRIIQPDDSVGQAAGDIVCRQRRGGLPKYHHRRTP
jgi:hypothetical protein